ncbi:MAG: helix-turn-helix transcriptional regulator [Muribaculaceae bacterium]|nr:helix-turn-helix transcriptional regulator [Muribaculaceae bacterium]
MPKLKVFNFDQRDYPLNERFEILDFSDSLEDIKSSPTYIDGFYCFLLLMEGEAELSVSGQKFKVESPSLITGLPGDTWEWKNYNIKKGSFICFDAPTIMAGLKDGFSLDPIPFLNPHNRCPLIPISSYRFQKLKSLIEEMKECLSDTPIFFDLLRAQIWQFIFLAEKEYTLNGKGGRNKMAKNHLVDFIHLVNLHFADHHDTTFYAESLNITPNYLNKLVKSKLNISAFQFIQNRIISEAKTLLRLTRININELAFRLGFENTSYFIKCFKKSEGMTPLEYHKLGTL